MSRETFSLLFFSLLAVVGVSASFHWMETHSTLDAQQALRQAKPVIQHLSQEKSTPLRLAQMTPPSNANSNWQIELQTPARKKVNILVQGNGATRVVQ